MDGQGWSALHYSSASGQLEAQFWSWGFVTFPFFSPWFLRFASTSWTKAVMSIAPCDSVDLVMGFLDEDNRIMSLVMAEVRHDFSTPLMLAVEEVPECYWLDGFGRRRSGWEKLTDFDLKSATGSPRCGKAATEQWSNAMVQGKADTNFHRKVHSCCGEDCLDGQDETGFTAKDSMGDFCMAQHVMTLWHVVTTWWLRTVVTRASKRIWRSYWCHRETISGYRSYGIYIHLYTLGH